VVDLVDHLPFSPAYFTFQPEASWLIPERAGAGACGLYAGGHKAEGEEQQLSSIHGGGVRRCDATIISAAILYVYVLCIFVCA